LDGLRHGLEVVERVRAAAVRLGAALHDELPHGHQQQPEGAGVGGLARGDGVQHIALRREAVPYINHYTGFFFSLTSAYKLLSYDMKRDVALKLLDMTSVGSGTTGDELL